MEFRTFTFATIFLVVGTILISNSECSPAPIQPEIKANFVEASLSSVKGIVPQVKKLFRQGRYYNMGYPLGGLGYGGGGAVASASASASASSGGLGMGYGGYPMMYGK